jgi:hypothetical protein
MGVNLRIKEVPQKKKKNQSINFKNQSKNKKQFCFNFVSYSYIILSHDSGEAKISIWK